ncbi:hypothetical protein [Phytohalomonas tamaricis]|nr:hypothetical protein [Phytohalomonas tamaricis]
MGKTSVSAFMATHPHIDTIKVKGRGQKSIDNFVAWVKDTYPQISNLY